MSEYSNNNNNTVSVGEWILTIFLTGIPFVGFILLLVWSFGSNTIESKKNWARAYLIWYVIGIVVALLFLFLFGGLAMLGAAANAGT